jgi:hypothetical protein
LLIPGAIGIVENSTQVVGSIPIDAQIAFADLMTEAASHATGMNKAFVSSLLENMGVNQV